MHVGLSEKFGWRYCAQYPTQLVVRGTSVAVLCFFDFFSNFNVYQVNISSLSSKNKTAYECNLPNSF